jgi:G:T/U-mismatch repair DNA glycosylase
LIAHDLKVLFVSGPPSVSALKSGHHFANETSPFWQSLLDCGLIDDRLRNYQENKLAKSYRLGIATLNKDQLTLTESANIKSKLKKNDTNVLSSCYLLYRKRRV